MNEYIPVGWEELVEHMKQELLQTAQVAAADYCEEGMKNGNA